MTKDMLDLARRAVACKGWRWLPGMLHGTPVGSDLKLLYRMGDLTLYLDADRLPDLTDAATLGCLLALVREAWGDPKASPEWDFSEEKWAMVVCALRDRWFFDKTEAGVLVRALEAAA